MKQREEYTQNNKFEYKPDPVQQNKQQNFNM